MALLSFFNTTEFYIIMAVVAAAVVVFAARPQGRGPVTEHLLGSDLIPAADCDGDDSPSLEFVCLDDGHVTLLRRGLEGVSTSGAVSLAVESDGVNVRIQERLVPGSDWDKAAGQALFDIDFLAPGRYHVQYNSERTGLFAAFPLHVRPGIRARRALAR